MNMSVERQRIANSFVNRKFCVKIAKNRKKYRKICDSLPFYAHVHTCSPSYTDEE